jgi:predicted dehydrogenase
MEKGMQAKTITIGVAGVGFGAAVHIPAFQSEGLEVVAICSRRQERAEEAAKRFGIPHAFTDLEEMLALPGLDAVSIVTPVALHHPMTLAALKAGKHVICEKPFTTDEKQARQLWQAAEGRLTAMIAHEFRFSSGRMRAKELIDEGYVGQPRLVLMRLMMGFGRPGAVPRPAEDLPPFNPERDLISMGAGFLWGLGSHYIDCLRHWLGEVESASGELRNFSPDRKQGAEIVKADADDTFAFTLRFRNGAIAEMVASRAGLFGSGAGVEIYGSEGTIFAPQRGVNPPAQGVLEGARTGEEARHPLEIPERLQPFADERDDRLMPFRLLTREFIRGINEGSSPAPNFYDGYRCQQVLDAVRESAATGRRVQIPE